MTLQWAVCCTHATLCGVLIRHYNQLCAVHTPPCVVCWSDTTISCVLYTRHPVWCADQTLQSAVCCTHATVWCADQTLQSAACCTHATTRCEPIKKSATSTEHDTSSHIYNILPSASWTEAPHSTSVTPISILSSHYHCPAASDNNLSTVLIFPKQPGYKSHSSQCGTCKWCCVTGCAAPDISKHLPGLLQPNMKALYYFKTSVTTHTL